MPTNTSFAVGVRPLSIFKLFSIFYFIFVYEVYGDTKKKGTASENRGAAMYPCRGVHRRSRRELAVKNWKQCEAFFFPRRFVSGQIYILFSVWCLIYRTL